ncbi:MAG: redox-regulated ATPase YchF [Dehalococcoidaceae bacterium]|nr:redox-regulated ATPase YchF [Dehalococcoidaceae bacterium]
MGFKCGIIGLPNVGKSTIFNALTQSQNALAANYPFATIEPNVGRVAVPDSRLNELAVLNETLSVIPTYMEFVDIAGLVKGANEGEGLGNKFLGHIREVDAIAHVLRCFEDENITHVNAKLNPIDDLKVIESELLFSDLDFLLKQQELYLKKIKSTDKEIKIKLEIINHLLEQIDTNQKINIKEIDSNSISFVNELKLLSLKPTFYICNVDESSVVNGNQLTNNLINMFDSSDAREVILVSASIESEISNIESKDEQNEFLKELGLENTSLDQVIKTGYHLLGLLTFFTAGKKEVRAWTIKQNTNAAKAAGKIHTDFEKGFIRAETISYNDYVELGGEHSAKNAGKMRQEGRDYIVQEGDIFHFLFNN